jgi:hypothetical protein
VSLAAVLPGVVQVTQTLPNEPDDELPTLYVLKVEARTDAVLRTLRKGRRLRRDLRSVQSPRYGARPRSRSADSRSLILS